MKAPRPALPSAGILDGGLAFELERRGHDLDHPLWTARILCDAPDAIAGVHRDYLSAGADAIITASYQASFAGLEHEGLGEREAESVIERSVDIAIAERDRYEESHPGERRWVLASVGPYGAFLADGSEYRGDYGVDADTLRKFHERRLRILSASAADGVVCETIPCRLEAEVLGELIAATPDCRAWVCFCCRDESTLCDGSSFADAATAMTQRDGVVAIGTNCVAPRLASSLVRVARRAAPRHPLVVYPNSGQIFDREAKEWRGRTDIDEFVQLAGEWRRLGASWIGGCCQVGPEYIRALRDVER